MFDVWQSSEYASGLLKLFYRGSERDTGERLIYDKMIEYVHSKLRTIPVFWSHTWNFNIQANERAKKKVNRVSTQFF